MRKFLDDNFLLNNQVAINLYHNHAKKMPIFDYHCHLSPQEIYEDKHYQSITDLWIEETQNGKAFGDHYKWRLMRANGIDEKFITGNGDKKEKFISFAKTLPYAIGNPLYHWSQLELKLYFGIDEPLSEENAEKIYDIANQKLKDLSARKLIELSNVDTVFTTDDPTSDLKYHQLLKKDKSFKSKVYPSFRPDSIINFENDNFLSYLKELESIVGYQIDSLDNLIKAIEERINFFDENHCQEADHGILAFAYQDCTYEECKEIFKSRLSHKVSKVETDKYKSYILLVVGKMYKERNWVQQYHLQATRNNNQKMFNLLGCDSGYDAIDDLSISMSLSRLLNNLEAHDALPKTIVYSLNQNDYEVIASLIHCFQKDCVPSRLQLGAAWWFNDHKIGMEQQLSTLANYGLLGHFIGMLTDSRSFLSYARHDYFRRILCNFIGTLVENGEYPNDEKFVGKVIENICFNNAKLYFKGDK